MTTSPATARLVGVEQRPTGPILVLTVTWAGAEIPVEIPICPGAERYVDGRPVWGWDGDALRPTLTPSICVPLVMGGVRKLLHIFVLLGRIVPCDDNQIEVSR